MAQPQPAFDDDRPISRREDDQFGRSKVADGIADDLLAGGAMAAAVVGPWGSGKSSVLNLVRARLDEHREEVVVIEFNPWLYSGTNELVLHFFDQLAAQLRSKDDAALKSAADRLESYADLLSPLSGIPVAGGAFGGVSKVVSGVARLLHRKAKFGSASVQGVRRDIEAALAQANRQFVVVIDDLDRLEQTDIRDVVRLVRLVADFPRTTYLLAFDRERVEKALGFGDIDLGRDYLEKIIQVLYPIPPVSVRAISSMAHRAIDRDLDRLAHRPLDQRYWGNAKTLIVDPLLRTPRDARRYANAARAAVRDLGTEINLADLLVLEAFRALMPGVWDKLPDLVVPLTQTSPGFVGAGDQYGTRRAEYKEALADLVRDGADRVGAVDALLHWVFPASQALTGNMNHGPEWARLWRAERRVANAEVLAIYFARTLPPSELPTPVVEAVYEAFSHVDELDALLNAFPDDLLGELLSRLEDFEHTYPADPTDAIVGLQNLLPRLPQRQSSLFSSQADPETQLHRVVLRLLRKAKPRSRRDEIVRAALPRIPTLSGRLWLIFIAGDRKSIGSKVISRAAQAAFEAQLRSDIKAATPEQLANERDLLRLLDFIVESKTPADVEWVRTTLSDARALTRVLRGAASETSSYSMGEVTVQRESVLGWDWLASILPEAELIAAIDALPDPDADATDSDAAVVRLAKRYAGGWRPRQFGDFGRDDDEPEEPEEPDPDAEPSDQPDPAASAPVDEPASVIGPSTKPATRRRGRGATTQGRTPRTPDANG